MGKVSGAFFSTTNTPIPEPPYQLFSPDCKIIEFSPARGPDRDIDLKPNIPKTDVLDRTGRLVSGPFYVPVPWIPDRTVPRVKQNVTA